MSSRSTTENQEVSQPITPPRSAAVPSSSPDVIAKVFFWMDNQLSAWDPKDARQVEPNSRPVTPDLPPTPISERKSVHWTPEVKDNEGKTLRKLRSSPSTAGHKRKASMLYPGYYPRVPEPPRGPPPAPRPRRLPTPELLDLKHEEFCSCCSKDPMSKMEAQRRTPCQCNECMLIQVVAAARCYMANSKQTSRRQIETAAMMQRK